ncbi:hypothetical protein [Thalassospira lucentensis]|uniref:hypothetical protein n=1 Tax=Thalassospira lucentensis TaxID=168935 RepID=UPI002942751F|nr:hypothetical protein [Thalassospira lucentensis]
MRQSKFRFGPFFSFGDHDEGGRMAVLRDIDGDDIQRRIAKPETESISQRVIERYFNRWIFGL